MSSADGRGGERAADSVPTDFDSDRRLPTSLLDLLADLGAPRVLVFGDLILDRYVEGTASRVSPEAPVLVFESAHVRNRIGGAGNVAANVVSAGGRATCLGLVGDDEAADRLTMLLREAGIETDGIIRDGQRKTTVKSRFVNKTHQVLRFDEETILPPAPDALAATLAFLAERVAEFDVVILSDYGKGVLTDACLRAVITAARERDVPVLVDPKGSDYKRYRGATLITPNKLEAEIASGITVGVEDDLDRIAQSLGDSAELDAVLITLGKDGIYFRTKGGHRAILPTEARAVFDVTGAGDTVVALLGMALGAGFGLGPAVRLANLGAGIVVGRFGTASVTRDELRGLLGATDPGKIVDTKELSQLLVALRNERRRIVFTNGCFDLLHPGHLDYLTKARAYGDVLIVGVNDDASIQRLKGPTRPICPVEDRLALLAGFEVIDHLVAFAEDTPLALIEQISPHVLAKGEDWRDKGVVGREWVESHGGQVVLIPLKQGHSTSTIIERVLALEAKH